MKSLTGGTADMGVLVKESGRTNRHDLSSAWFRYVRGSLFADA